MAIEQTIDQKRADLVPAAHVDITTMMGVIDALGLAQSTRELPTPFDLILTLAQFVESLVVHERLVYEENPSPAWEPYLTLIEKSGIAGHLGNEIIGTHWDTSEDEETDLVATRWAVTKILSSTMDFSALREAVVSRGSLYRVVYQETLDKPNPVLDKSNPVLERYLTLVDQTGDAALQADVEEASARLDSSGIGGLGLHVLVRLYLLHEWIAQEAATSYVPHFSRSSLVEDTLASVRQRRLCYQEWALQEIRDHRESIIEQFTKPFERSDLTLSLPPIFLTCLKKAHSPFDILEEALKLREKATEFRVLCRRWEAASRARSEETISLRAQLDQALRDFDERLRGISGGFISYSGGRTFLRPERTSAGGEATSQGLAFLTDVLGKTIGLLDVESELTRVFGRISGMDWALVSQFKR